MISFQPTEEESAFIEMARNIAETKIRPLARQCEQNKMVNKELIEELAGLGLLSMELPESWACLELPLISQVQILQALSYGDLDVVQGLPGAGDTASLIRLLERDAHFALLKEQSRQGRTLTGALLDLTDHNVSFGSEVNVDNIGDEYLLNGVSQPVRLGAFADYLILLAVDSAGISIVLLLDEPEQWQAVEGDYRLGLLSSGIARLSFHEVKVPNSKVLVKGTEAELLIKRVKTRIRILEAAKEVGIMEAALDYATEYTANRKAFGQEIAKFQGVSFRVARMAIETRAANLLVWEAAIKADENIDNAFGLALRALYAAHRSARYVTDSAVQLLGGHGFVQEFPVEKWMRDAQAQVMLYGSENELLTMRGEQLVTGSSEAKEMTVY